MKKLLVLIISILLFLSLSDKANAIYDPLSVKNNIFGIHILYPEEISEASALINSSDGDWGYVTIPIKASDRNLDKWQTFMDNCRKYHVIPIIRIATDGDYFDKISWSKPSEYEVLDFANFLNSLNWPVKNRYVIIYNEPNRGDEWGGIPNAAEYAKILDYSVNIFKEKSQDFFIISAGLDNASVNISNQSINNFTYMFQMNDAIPQIFAKIDGIASHSYPNPAFSSPPSFSRMGIYSFYYQNQLANTLSGKNLPVFITETGWSSDNVSQNLQADYYRDSFANFWNDKNIVAITPFIFSANQGAFMQFSFTKNGEETGIYKQYRNFQKIKGEPKLTNYFFKQNDLKLILKTRQFENNNSISNMFGTVDKSTKTFFKWLLKL